MAAFFENEVDVVTARLAPLRSTEKSETRGLTFKDKRVPVTSCDADAPLSHYWRSGEPCRSVSVGEQLPPWCLFVPLDFRPEGFEPSRHELDPG